MGAKGEIYEVKRVVIAGRTAIFSDMYYEFALNGVKHYRRVVAYQIVTSSTELVSVTLTATTASYHKVLEQFNAILKTLKFIDKK